MHLGQQLNSSTDQQDFFSKLVSVLGAKNIIIEERGTRFYRTGFRVGQGECCAVALPETLLQIWQVLKICVAHDKAIIMQAANTSLNGGATPFGNGYDREIVIINTLKIDQINLINDGHQVVALAGSTLYGLEDKLRPLNRGPHSVIGSSCIGASIIGGVCNSSGGNLVNRGPSYTEMSVYAQLDAEGNLSLLNHLGIDLGDTPEEILNRLQSGNFDKNPPTVPGKLASDSDYQQRVRDIEADTPARYNADQRRLYEASGCSGKLAVFAVRLDTFPLPQREKIFYIGTNSPQQLTRLRRRILSEFNKLPEMGEYLHRSYFDSAAKYSKDTFLFIKYVGTAFLPRLSRMMNTLDTQLSKLPFLPSKLPDRILQSLSKLLPNHLPARLQQYREKYEHHLIIKSCDEVIEETQLLLENFFAEQGDGEFFACSEQEGKDALLHRFVCGGAPVRFALSNGLDINAIVPMDIALRRNDEGWHDLYPPEILDKVVVINRLSHFFCMVLHHDFVLKDGVDPKAFKAEVMALLEARGAKYPAEHNVGHLYEAEQTLRHHYKTCDPCNAFNPGVGNMSKRKYYAES